MRTLEWRTIDKSTWGPGEWQDEPDKRQWQDEATGLPCLAVRHKRSGHWCGYVGVSDSHPWHGVPYNGCTQQPPCGEPYCDHEPSVEVHGGLTYSDRCQATDDESVHICHLPEPGEPADVWWFGFDCHHAWDAAPGYAARYRDDPLLGARDPSESYRTLEYVTGQCVALARQLAAQAK
jgi:hypothetical protein